MNLEKNLKTERDLLKSKKIKTKKCPISKYCTDILVTSLSNMCYGRNGKNYKNCITYKDYTVYNGFYIK